MAQTPVFPFTANKSLVARLRDCYAMKAAKGRVTYPYLLTGSKLGSTNLPAAEGTPSQQAALRRIDEFFDAQTTEQRKAEIRQELGYDPGAGT